MPARAMPARDGALVFALCTAEVIGMLGFAAFPALLPSFMATWNLGAADAGWINGIYYFGYLLAVPVLVGGTDRVSAKRITLFSLALTAASSAGFALFADGFWTAMAFRLMAGIGLAGTYMPGLKILSDHLDAQTGAAGRRARVIAFYTASFSIGSSLSFFFAGETAALWGWRWTFALAALGPVVALALVHVFVAHEKGRADETPDTHLLDFRPVLRCRAAMGYVLAYAAHNFELFAWRSWIVAFLVFAGFRQSGGDWMTATVLATAINLVGLPASILGNEIASRFGRRRVVAAIMLTSAAFAAGLGFVADMPLSLVAAACLLYGVTVTGDSASITAGLVESAPSGRRGAAMAVHSCIGFTGAFLGPLMFGLVLQGAGGTGETWAWVAAFATTGLVVALGPVALAWAARAGTVTPRG